MVVLLASVEELVGGMYFSIVCTISVHIYIYLYLCISIEFLHSDSTFSFLATFPYFPDL